MLCSITILDFAHLYLFMTRGAKFMLALTKFRYPKFQILYSVRKRKKFLCEFISREESIKISRYHVDAVRYLFRCKI